MSVLDKLQKYARSPCAVCSASRIPHASAHRRSLSGSACDVHSASDVTPGICKAAPGILEGEGVAASIVTASKLVRYLDDCSHTKLNIKHNV